MKLQDADQFLNDLGFNNLKSKERSCRTLLALAELTYETNPADATRNMHTVRSLMDWLRNHLDDDIAENSRETIRRQILKFFVSGGLCYWNEDEPARSTNSSKSNYSLTEEAHRLLLSFGTTEYPGLLVNYLKERPGLQAKYQRARNMALIPVTLPDGVEVRLSAGGQNPLIKAMISDFCSRFVTEAEVLYIGDTAQKYVHYDRDTLSKLRISVPDHGKMPDLIVHSKDKNWLFLMEAASTHGPVDQIRYDELQEIFSESLAGLVLVSCFNDRRNMRQYAADLAWETEVWIASEPEHMIHLNGSRFLGPYGAQ